MAVWEIIAAVLGPIYIYLAVLVHREQQRQLRERRQKKWTGINKEREAMGRKLLKLRGDPTLTPIECLFWGSICELLDEEFEQNNNNPQTQSFSLAEVARRNLKGYQSLG